MTTLQTNNLKGVMFNLSSMLLFTIMDILVKKLVVELPVYEVIFFRCLTGIPFFIVFAYYTAGLSSLKIVNIKFQFARAIFGVIGMFFFFNAYKYLPLADAGAILFSAPLILTVLSVLFLKEKIGIHRTTAIIIGFIGVLFIARPGGQGMSAYMLLPLVGAFCWSFVVIIMRVLSRTDHPNGVTLVFSLIGTLTAGVLVIYNGGFSDNITGIQMLMLVVCGIVGIFAQCLMMIAVKWAEASVFGSTKYLSLVFAILAGYFVFDETPAFYTFVGIFLIILSGLYNVWREYVLAKEQRIKTLRY